VIQVPPIFIDDDLQQQFDKDGYVKISLLDDDEIEQLTSSFYRHMKRVPDAFYSSSYLHDSNHKIDISNEIGQIITPKLKDHFRDYTWFGSAFLSKGSGSSTEMPMHQDWTIVDENKFVALNIWTPLQDTDEANGTLEVIPGSHRFHDCMRAPTLPFYFKGFEDQMKKLLKPIHTKANEAIVLNQAVIHYSKPNMTNKDRLAITTGIKSKDAPMVFYYWNKNTPDTLEAYAQEDDFLLRWNDFFSDIFLKPTQGHFVGQHSFHFPKSNEAEVNQLLGHHTAKATEKRNFWKRIFGS
jgi:hypothetical protein